MLRVGKVIVIFGVCGIVLLFFSGLHAQKPIIEMKDAEGKVSNPIYKPVIFEHQKHYPLGCQTCHHKWKDMTKPPSKCTAKGCHDLIGVTGEDMVKTESAFNAYHKRTSIHSCVGCHTKKKAEGVKAGPIACVKCHNPNPNK